MKTIVIMAIPNFTKEKFMKKNMVIVMATIGLLVGCGESPAEHQARVYREYTQAGGNPVQQVPQYQQPIVIQQSAPGISAGESALGGMAVGMAAGAFLTHAMMKPREAGESNSAFAERRRRWEAEDAQIRAENRARFEREKNARLKNSNADLREQLAASERKNAQPVKQNNPAIFAQPQKEGTNFSRQSVQPKPTNNSSTSNSSSMFSNSNSSSSRRSK
jgi:hypothetical protein